VDASSGQHSQSAAADSHWTVDTMQASAMHRNAHFSVRHSRAHVEPMS
jgi:hypothetical protein